MIILIKKLQNIDFTIIINIPVIIGYIYIYIYIYIKGTKIYCFFVKNKNIILI